MLKISLVSLSFLLAASGASALEVKYSHPTYKRQAPLDICLTFGKNCGKPVADMCCRIQGYERATGFKTEHASPTRIMSDRKTCVGDFCTAFSSINCFTSAAVRGPGIGWPQGID
jgi:hypothetical protein